MQAYLQKIADRLGKAQARLEALYDKRKTVYTINGEGWFQHEGVRDGKRETKRFPARYLEEWIKKEEIEVGLLEGRLKEGKLLAAGDAVIEAATPHNPKRRPRK